MAPPSQPASPAEGHLGLVHIARRVLQSEDLFSETCRRDCFCIRCCRAFCSHCCGFHHTHAEWHVGHVVCVDLDAGGRPVFPTRTSPEGYPIPGFIAKIMADEDYTSRLRRDAFCLHCAAAFCADICSHHGGHRRLADAVIRVEERGGGHCVRCAGGEWWVRHMGAALGDPVHRDEQGRYDLLPVMRLETGRCVNCGGHVPWQNYAHCSTACFDKYDRDTEER